MVATAPNICPRCGEPVNDGPHKTKDDCVAYLLRKSAEHFEKSRDFARQRDELIAKKQSGEN